MLEGVRKREKIGDRGADTHRFRFDYLFSFLVLLEHLFLRIDISSLRWLACLCVLTRSSVMLS